jgi:hypothetical protein
MAETEAEAEARRTEYIGDHCLEGEFDDILKCMEHEASLRQKEIADLEEEIAEAWAELTKVAEIPGAEVYPLRGGPLWEAIEVLRLQLKQAKA